MNREPESGANSPADPASEPHDVTARNRALGLAALQVAPWATLIHDSDGRFTDVSAAACKLLAYSRDDLLGATLNQLRGARPVAGSGTDLKRLEAGESLSATWNCTRGDGVTLNADVRSIRLNVPGRPRYASYPRDRAPKAAARSATERRLSIFLDENPCVCFQKGADGRYELINQRFADLFKITADGVLGKTDYDLFPTAIADAVAANDRQVAATGQLLVVEEDVPSEGGVRRYLSYKFPICDAAGRVVSVAGIAIDITERVQAETRLRIKERQLSVFFDDNPAMCFQKDLEGRYEFVNRKCAEVFGMDAAESLGKLDRDLFPAESAAQFRVSDEQVLASGTTVVVEQAVPGPQGTRWFLTHKFPIRGDDDRIVGIAGIGTEVTELKLAEARTRAGERRYRDLVELAPDAVLVVRDGIIALVNSAAVRLFGVSGAGVLIGTLYSDLFDESGDQPIRELNEQVLEGALTRPQPDLCIVAPDGTRKTVEVSAAHFDGPDGLAIQVIIRDQTERRRLEESLVEVTEQERRRFGADLHDDLGQWLTGAALMLGTYQSAIESAGGDGATAGKIRSIVIEALERARSLARGFAPDLERGGLVPALAALSQSCTERFKLECVFDGSDTALADLPAQAAMQLYRIAQEATTNVARHAHAHRIRIALRRRAADVTLRIEDDGAGIMAGLAESAEGMGIRSMRYRARLLGGTLTVANAAEGGTVVECCCPLPRNAALTPPPMGTVGSPSVS